MIAGLPTPVETRPIMTRAEFERRASDVNPGWWLTGEDFIRLPLITTIDGWNQYGHPGNAQLTEAQRVLMMWSDLVGQVSNGGFEQFVANYEASLKLAYGLIGELDWPDLRERFDRAFREQAGDPAAPEAKVPADLDEDPEKWAASRQRFLRHLARKYKPETAPVTAQDIAAVEARYAEWELQLAYQLAVHKGEIESGGERLFDFEPPPNTEADAFDTWLYLDSTKQASRHYVGAYIRAHRAQLCRISD